MTADLGARGEARLIALDWGTTSLRAYLLGDAGMVLERRAEPLGILNVTDRDFAGVLASITDRWRGEHPELRAIASGMIGSAQGWIEAPYVGVPADLPTIARGLVMVPDSSLAV